MGLKPNEIQFFVAPDTGVKLPIHKVSPALLQEVERSLRKEMPAPQPPRQPVDYGDGRIEYEENNAEPGYLAALDKWKTDFNNTLSERSQRLMVRLGVLPYLTLTDEQVQQVKDLRQVMQDEFNVTLDGDDKWIFVNMIALGTVEDIGDLTTQLIRRSTVTDGGIADALRKF